MEKEKILEVVLRSMLGMDDEYEVMLKDYNRLQREINEISKTSKPGDDIFKKKQ